MSAKTVVNAPIAIFAYKRPDHLQELIRSLEANKIWFDSPVIFYVDGAKKAADVAPNNKVIDIVNNYPHSNKSIKISSQNRGLANSIITGVSEVLNKYDKIIVLEDDLVLHSRFLEFMNHGLNDLENYDQVISIQGYSPITNNNCYYLRGADCWGWATWNDRWNLFESDGKRLIAEIDRLNLKSKFNLNDSYPYYEMLKRQVAGLNDSWAIRWHASAFLAKKLSLYPASSLVLNRGMDGSGTNAAKSTNYDVELEVGPNLDKHFFPVTENPSILKAIQKKNRSLFHYYPAYTLKWLMWGIIRRIKNAKAKLKF